MTRLLILLFALLGACGGRDTEPVHAHDAETVWTCSMHPQIRQPEPGACPICGMDLIPAGASASTSNDEVVWSERARRLAGLRTTTVRRGVQTHRELHLLGRVETAESQERTLPTWVGGRIDRLHVKTTGETIRRGQRIATLYSPEIYAAHQDLITAHRLLERLTDASPPTRAAAEASWDAARERLRLLGVAASELDRMADADRPLTALSVHATASGTVLELLAQEGAYVQTGAPLYRLADLGTLWVQLDAYERDLVHLAAGQEVELQVDAMPEASFEGRIDFIDPTVDRRRRTSRVRVVVDDHGGRLRPGMFAEARVRTESRSTEAPLVIPTSAPLFTGRRSVVYVETSTERGPRYRARTVRLGPRLGEGYPVVSGLAEGERVVTRGAFALDADLQIRGGPSMMSRADDTVVDPTPPLSVPPPERVKLVGVLTHYLAVQRALADDQLEAARTAATALESAVDEVELSLPLQDPWSPIGDVLRRHAAHLAHATELEGARAGFQPMSAAMESLLTRFGNPLDDPLHIAFCPMAMDNTGARWVQSGSTVDNAYFGQQMRRCGEILTELSPGTHLEPEAPISSPAGHEGHAH